MKTLFTLFLCAFFALNIFGQITLPIMEEFDIAPNENKFGVFDFNNYGSADVADPNYTAYTIEQDATGMLSGTNSAKMNITATGNQWWTIQVRLGTIDVNAGDKLEVSYTAISTMDMSFRTALETANTAHDPEPFRIQVDLKPYERRTISYTTPVYPAFSQDWFMIAAGNSTTIAGTLWIDSISIKAIPGVNGIKDFVAKEKWQITQLDNLLQIESNGISNSLKVEFFDLLGRKFASQNIQHTGTSKVTLPEYHNAIYIVRIMDEHNNFLAGKKIQVIK